MWGFNVTWPDSNPLPIPLYICEGLMWHDQTASHYQYHYKYVMDWFDMTRQLHITNTAIHIWGIDVTWPDSNPLPIPLYICEGFMWHDQTATHYQYHYTYVRDWYDMTRQQPITNTTIYICEGLMWHGQTATHYQYRNTYVRDWCDMTRQLPITNTTIHMWGIDVTWIDSNQLTIPLYIFEGLMWHDQILTHYQYRYTYVREWCDMTRQQPITNTATHMWRIDVT